MNSKQTDRRRFLQGGAAMVGLAAGGLTPARAQEILPQGLAVGAIGEDGNATGVGGDQADNSADGSGAVYVFE